MMRPALHSYLVLLDPARVARRLAQIERSELVRSGLLERAPNLWQIEQGVLRMWHRVLFRSETIGTSAAPVRSTLRARLLHERPLRFPFLLWERAVAPLDFSGLLSSPERVIRHLLGAHHEGSQFVYDLRMLALHEGQLEALRERAAAVVDGSDPRAEWLRDLAVHEGYHESLLAAVDAALAGRFEADASEAEDPDISFLGYLRWCVAQPETPRETWAALRTRGAASEPASRRATPPARVAEARS